MNTLESNPRISVIVNVYNMKREAERTLFSLTTNYQHGINAKDYEVIVVENGSTEPLEESWIKNFGENFHYVYFDSKSPSPCAAMNYAVFKAKASLLMCCIDGARILSPGILKYALLAFKLHENPFIYTMGMHIGPELQNILVSIGYNQNKEDELMKTIGWRNNGYELFKISSVAMSSKDGFFSELNESNCFSMKKSDFIDIGGFEEKFVSPGGGMVNLDLFNRVHEDVKYSPIMLLGEATFHQFHHGVATNVPLEQHPINEMLKEYEIVRGKQFQNIYRRPEYYGWLTPKYHSTLMAVKWKNVAISDKEYLSNR